MKEKQLYGCFYREKKLEAGMTERIWNIQSVANACQNIILVAKALDLGSCWMGALLVVETEIKQILQASDNARLMVVLAVDYPAEKPLPRIRKSLAETAYYEKWEKRF